MSDSSIPATPSASSHDDDDDAPEVIDVDALDVSPADVSDSRHGRVAPSSSTYTMWYVSVPRLSPGDQASYVALNMSDSESDPDESEVVEFVGELKLGSSSYLYARYKDGIKRRMELETSKRSHSALLKRYELRKKTGKLKPFNPSAADVYHRHRVRPQLNVDTRRASAKPTRDSDAYNTLSELTESSDSEDEDEDGGDDDYGYTGRRLRKRARSPPRRNLPFSPKRIRARGGVSSSRARSDGEDESESKEEEMEYRPRATRTRAAAVAKRRLDTDDESVEVRTVKKARTAQRRCARPAYGRIADVDDIYDSDLDTAPLRAHRSVCEKCHREAAHILLSKLLKKKGRKKKKSDDGFSEDEQELFTKLGGWVQCLKCPVTAHWRCLANTQRQEILKAIRAREASESDAFALQPQRRELDTNETTDFLCNACSKGGTCMYCNDVVVAPETVAYPESLFPPETSEGNKEMGNTEIVSGVEPDNSTNVASGGASEIPRIAVLSLERGKELAFRCFACKRLAHYHCLKGETTSPVELADLYQTVQDWQCSDCSSYTYPLDRVLAWRPYPPGPQLKQTITEVVNYRDNLPRQYLVKWKGRSYRRTCWVPHMWLLSTNGAKLKHFLQSGAKVPLLDNPTIDDADVSVDDAAPLASVDALAAAGEEGQDDLKTTPSRDLDNDGPPPALPDAERRIPILWKTADRVLDVLMLQRPKRRKSRPRSSKAHLISSSDYESAPEPELESASDPEPEPNPTADSGSHLKHKNERDLPEELERLFDEGEQPPDLFTRTLSEYESAKHRSVNVKDADKVVWAFIKWDDLGYDEATWDTPPRPGEFGYSAFVQAFDQFARSREVCIPKVAPKSIEALRKQKGKTWDPQSLGVPEDGNYVVGQGKYRLMDFQVTGVNWLCNNWFYKQPSILADEMGLGKTVQLITFLGILYEKLKIAPALIVVPNSTITNWVREFSRWAPKMRVVPLYGEAPAREVINKYELRHEEMPDGCTPWKFHVLVTTYDTITNAKESVFAKVPRWEVLVVDEGQRLKNDSNLLFKRLNDLNIVHRILMTGTPLNNNVRELFNLMNFLDPDKWDDLERLEEEYADLNDERVRELHERLRPYFLRRVKGDVLKLPPKNEVIVPVSMTPLQKEVYKSILSSNIDLLRSLTEASSSRNVKYKYKGVSKLNNMVMQLRKCLQHPYLIADDIEPKGLTPALAHAKLIDASSKLRLLKLLLPRLKERGHRVLLFSQFVIVLNIIEDFLQEEGYRFLRLDGNTKQAQRQRDMDEFNRPDSDVFVYMLSTRAGGVGINLWSADTVIIFDPDYNPHQDLQAIARAHRFGQTKSVLVFKLMVKDSAEERIMQTGKKKLALDHLILQKMDDEKDADDVQSILTFGAKALFDDSDGQNARDITYSESDIAKLVEKTETEGDIPDKPDGVNNLFAFAKVWSANKDTLEEMPEEPVDNTDQGDTWAQTLAQITTTTKVLVQEKAGRGVRRKAAAKVSYYEGVGSPDKAPVKVPGRKKSRSSADDDSDFDLAMAESEASSATGEVDTMLMHSIRTVQTVENAGGIAPSQGPLTSRQDGPKSGALDAEAALRQMLLARHSRDTRSGEVPCGLCRNKHEPGSCAMITNSVNLAHYRWMLITIVDEESWEDRTAAVRVVDEVLRQRGHSGYTAGQPLEPYRTSKSAMSAPWKTKPSFKLKSGAPKESHLEQIGSNPMLQAGTRQQESAPGERPTKKPQLQTICPVCEQSTSHSVFVCPSVLQGSASIIAAIKRLSNADGDHWQTITHLQNILRRIHASERHPEPNTGQTKTS